MSTEPRLGYLLKHAYLRYAELSAAALGPHGVDGRELAVLRTVSDGQPASQQELAGRLGVDRTTMVGLLDALEDKGLVRRVPDAADRRRNVVEATAAGADALAAGGAAADRVEREFLAALGDPAAAAAFHGALRTLADPAVARPRTRPPVPVPDRTDP